jgi:tetratricopeptide (TPR) repeat protein
LKAENYADSALKLDPNLAEAHAAKGYVEFYYFWRWEKAEQEFKEAIRLNPQFDITYDYYGYLLTATERFSEAQDILAKAIQIGPNTAAFATDMGVSLYYDKKYDQAIDEINNALKYNSRYPLAHLWLARVYQVRKNFPESIASYQRALKSNPSWVPSLAGIGNVYGNMGQPAEAKKILNQLLIMSDSAYVTPYGVALVYVGINNLDKTFEWLDKAYADRAHWLVWLKLDPRWDPIRSDKRYAPLVAKIGLPQTTNTSTH